MTPEKGPVASFLDAYKKKKKNAESLYALSCGTIFFPPSSGS